MTQALAVAGLNVVEAGAWIVREVWLQVASASVIALMGGSGAGKSALLESLAGCRKSVRGQIMLHGRQVSRLDASKRLQLGIALVPQRPPLFRGLSVAEHLALGIVKSRSREAGARSRVLRLIPELAGRAGTVAQSLGPAERRLLDIGRALMSAPEVLLLDEPSLDLDPERLAELLAMLREEGVAVVIAERFIGSTLDVADAGLLMIAGRIAAYGPPQTLRADPRLKPACMGWLATPQRNEKAGP